MFSKTKRNIETATSESGGFLFEVIVCAKNVYVMSASIELIAIDVISALMVTSR